ncbi:MAG: glycoside hydrolase family 31 protein [bacterium]|nr:glycoside hydrolase family 31 protein [bacterium]
MTQPNISLDNLAIRCRPERLTGIDVRRARTVLRTAGASAELTTRGDGIVQVVWHPSDEWQNEPTSYAAIPDARPGPAWKPKRGKKALSAGTATVAYRSDPLRLRFADASGTFLSESVEGPFGYLDPGAVIAWDVSKDERIYGLGQNAGAGLNRVGQVRGMAADHAGGLGGDVPIGFWVSARGYGVVVDNPNVASFDLRRKGRVTFSARDGYLSYFVLWGPTIADVLSRYVELTGRPPMPPRWLLGPLFSRIPGGRVPGYRSDRELVALARKLRARHIPCDGLILDYQWDERIGAFRWARKRFGRARWMLRELDRMGLQTIVQLKPAVNCPAPTAAKVQSDGMVLARRDGSPHTSNFHWGKSLFLDFFRERTRHWYSAQLARLSADGVAGWWTDEGDWIGFLSPSARDLARSPDGMRNLYNNAWCRTIYRGQRRRGSRRVVNITRSGSAGIQRFGTSIWSGDVPATWDGLAAQLQMGLNMGLSGVPFWTTDGGGFLGHPSPELYVRWAQFAVFSPLTRFHGCGPREPWHFGKQAEQAVRHVLEWRMRLLPYVYATAWHAHTRGLPMMRAMALADPGDRRLANVDSQYFFGDALLVSPVTEPLSVIRKRGGKLRTRLIPGTWYDLWTGALVISAAGSTGSARARVVTTPDLQTIPVHVRAPAVIVLGPSALTSREQSWDLLTIRVYAGDPSGDWQCRFDLYEDDGRTYAYENGAHLITAITVKRRSSSSFSLRIAPQGRRPSQVPSRRSWRLEIFGPTRQPLVRMGKGNVGPKKCGCCWAIDLPSEKTTMHREFLVYW